jgi:hypothetical protein
MATKGPRHRRRAAERGKQILAALRASELVV